MHNTLQRLYFSMPSSGAYVVSILSCFIPVQQHITALFHLQNDIWQKQQARARYTVDILFQIVSEEMVSTLRQWKAAHLCRQFADHN